RRDLIYGHVAAGGGHVWRDGGRGQQCGVVIEQVITVRVCYAGLVFLCPPVFCRGVFACVGQAAASFTFAATNFHVFPPEPAVRPSARPVIRTPSPSGGAPQRR